MADDIVVAPVSTEAPPAAPQTLNDIIKTSHTEVTKNDAKPDEAPGDAKETKTGEDTKPSGDKKEEKPPTSTEEKSDAEKELTPAEQKYANDLFRSLNDPASAKVIVKALAEQAGLIETKQEEKIVVKTITELLKEQLGEDLAFLGDKLGPAIEAVVKQQVAEQTKDIRQTQLSAQEQALNTKIDNAITKLDTEHTDFKDHKADILKLMDTHLPSKDQDVNEYFLDLYHIAKGRSGKVTSIDTKIVEKTRNNVAERLSSSAKVITPSQTAEIPKPMDLSSAIAAAKAEMQKDK